MNNNISSQMLNLKINLIYNC